MKNLSEIPNDPRAWEIADVESVKEYCKQQGGAKKILLFPSPVKGLSPIFADYFSDGRLKVYYWQSGMQTVFYFYDPFTVEPQPHRT